MNEYNSIKRKLTKGIFWKGLERICAQTVSMIVSIVLARILAPDDYSVVSIATIFFAFCNLFISSGMNMALIQKKDSDALDYGTVLITNLFFAALLYGIMFFASPFIADIYEKPVVVPVIRVMALTFFINGYKAVLSAKISSDMRFGAFFWSTIIGTAVSAVAGILLALKGFGAWALVAQQMINSFIDSLILTFTAKLKICFRFSKSRFRRLYQFGGKIFFASVISTIYDECKPLIVGLKFSTVDLAYYNKGSSFPSVINSIANNTFSSALFPAMANMQDDRSAISNMARRFIKTTSFLVFPMMAGFMAISESFVKVVLTDKWLPIVPYLMIFCISYAFDLVQIGNLQVIRALGRSDYILKMEIVKKASYFITIALFVWLSSSPVALAGSAIICTVFASLVNIYPNRKLIGYTYSAQIKDMAPNLAAALVMFIGVYLMKNICINIYALLVLQILAGICIYLLINLIIKNENLYYFIGMIKGARKK